jgi:hypothetical protein
MPSEMCISDLLRQQDASEWCQVVTCLMQQEATPLITCIWVGTACEQLLPDRIVDARQAHQLVQVVLADGEILHSSDGRAFSSLSHLLVTTSIFFIRQS